MREAIGGSILFYIILGFLAVYIVFIGVIMNYAATYRASNFVITSIEKTEGASTQDIGSLCEDLRSRSYHNTLSITCQNNSNGAVYTVVTNVKFEVPIIGFDTNLYIKNETKTIYGVKCLAGASEISRNCG